MDPLKMYFLLKLAKTTKKMSFNTFRLQNCLPKNIPGSQGNDHEQSRIVYPATVDEIDPYKNFIFFPKDH